MTGCEWPPLVPDPPGQEGKLPAIVPKVPCSSKNVALKKVVTMEAGSLNSAYRQLEQHGLWPVPVGSESYCKDTPKIKVVQDHQEMDWDLMRLAVPEPKDRVKEGINKDDKAMGSGEDPKSSGRVAHGTKEEKKALDGPPEKAVTMVKKKRRKGMNSKKKEQLKNRSIFCGPMKTKKKKSKKSKVDGKDVQEAAVPPKVDLLYFLSWIHIDLLAQELPRLQKRKGKKKEPSPRKVPQTLDLSAEVIKYSPTLPTYLHLSVFQPIDVSHIFVADKHEQPQRRRSKSPKDNVVVQVDNSRRITFNLNHFFIRAQTGFRTPTKWC